MWAVQGILAALYARQRTGKGRLVECSLLETASALARGPAGNQRMLMGVTLSFEKRRQWSLIKAGGFWRIRSEVERYDIRSMKRLPPRWRRCRDATLPVRAMVG